MGESNMSENKFYSMVLIVEEENKNMTAHLINDGFEGLKKSLARVASMTYIPIACFLFPNKKKGSLEFMGAFNKFNEGEINLREITKDFEKCNGVELNLLRYENGVPRRFLLITKNKKGELFYMSCNTPEGHAKNTKTAKGGGEEILLSYIFRSKDWDSVNRFCGELVKGELDIDIFKDIMLHMRAIKI